MAEYFNLKNKALLTETGWISGKPARTASGIKPFAVHDPATDRVWAYQETMNSDDAAVAIAGADAAFPAYSRLPPTQRARLLLELDRLLRENREDFAQLIVMETGKALPEAYGEVDYAASYTWMMAGECERMSGEIVKHGSNKDLRFLLTHHPIGPVGVLTPWNFPLVIGVRKITTALAAGCTVVVKPSPETPITTTAFAKLCTAAGYPDGVVNVVTASLETTPEIGRTLCQDSRIKKITFTGSTRVGKLLMEQCSGTLKKLTMELGGNGAFIVYEDADLEKAATALTANKFRAAGQVCMCANRVLVHKSVMEPFSNIFAKKIAQLKFGHGLDAGITNGAMTTKQGPRRLETLVKDAVEQGGKLVTGGKPFGPGYHFEPTLIVGASKDSRIFNEEIFGPIAALYPFETEEESIALCNNTDFGLTNYIFTENLGRALRVSDVLESGTVAVNTPMANAAESPFGGIKESGFGKEGGFGHGVEEFCYVKAVALSI